MIVRGDSLPPLVRTVPGLSLRRRIVALGGALAGLPLLTVVMVALRAHLELPSVLLLYLSFVVGVAAAGGWWPALIAAVAAFAFANWFFTPPLHTFAIGKRQNLLALLVFIVVAGVVAAFVDLAARRRADAERGRAEAEALARLAGALALEADPLPALLDGLLATFALNSGAILRSDRVHRWMVEAHAGSPAITDPSVATDTFALRDGSLLIVLGPKLARADAGVLRAFLAGLEAGLDGRRMRKEVALAAEVTETSNLRGSILAAVSHDLRTPLSSVKAAVSSLRQTDVVWNEAEVTDFLETIEEETDRLTGLIGNLLDMSRLQAKALKTVMKPVGLEEVVPRALAGLRDRTRPIQIDVSESLPRVLADATLLERAVVNVLDNANTWSPQGRPVRVTAGTDSEMLGSIDSASVENDGVANGVADDGANGMVLLRVADEGPGIDPKDWDRVFQPFQRLGDTPDRNGIGLGFAVAKGFVEAMGGTLTPEQTPGGGLTIVIRLQAAER